MRDLRERFAKFSLRLHPDKTRLIEFGRFAAERRAARGLGKLETFDFLGFTARLREDPGGAVLAAAHHGLEADAGAEAERGQGSAQATPARASPRARTVAGQRDTRPPGLLHRTRQRPGGSILPETGDPALARGVTQPQPASPPELGPDEPPGDTMATTRLRPAPLPRRTLRRSHPRQEPSALVAHAGICAGGRPRGRSPTAISNPCPPHCQDGTRETIFAEVGRACGPGSARLRCSPPLPLLTICIWHGSGTGVPPTPPG